MKEVEIKERIKKLDKLMEKAQKEMQGSSSGRVRIVSKRKGFQCYLVTSETNKAGKYVRKEDMEIVRHIVQKEYCEKVYEAAKEEKSYLLHSLRFLHFSRPEEVVEKLGKWRKGMIKPLAVSDSEYVERWLGEKYKGNPYNPEECIYETKRGEMVRTKGELLIADMYNELGIPYKYEYPLKLKNGKIKYPDFTLLKLPERELIYHEHMGKLESPDYLQNNLLKLREYEESGVHCCKNLILTFETSQIPLSISEIRKLVKSIWSQ